MFHIRYFKTIYSSANSTGGFHFNQSSILKQYLLLTYDFFVLLF